MNRVRLAAGAALSVVAMAATAYLPGAYRDSEATRYVGYPLPGLDADSVIKAAQQVMPTATTRQSASDDRVTIIDNNDSVDPLLSGNIRVSRGKDGTVTDVTCRVTSEHGELSPILAVCVDLPVDNADAAQLRAAMEQLFGTAPVDSSTSVRYPRAHWRFSMYQYQPVVRDYWISVTGRSE